MFASAQISSSGCIIDSLSSIPIRFHAKYRLTFNYFPFNNFAECYTEHDTPRSN